MSTLYYFAYGSNLHPLRLQERVPSASVIGVVRVECRKLTFAKRSIDGSGKCSFYETSDPEDVLFGVLYKFHVDHKPALDKAEGKGYDQKNVKLEHQGKQYLAYTYIADIDYIDESLQPYEWYKLFVIEGAKYHSMPDDYLTSLENIPAIPDLNTDRLQENMERLNRMQELSNNITS